MNNCPESLNEWKKTSAKMIYTVGNSYIIILIRAVSFNIIILTNIPGVKLNDSCWPFYDPFITKTQYFESIMRGSICFGRKFGAAICLYKYIFYISYHTTFTKDKLIRLWVLTLVTSIPIVDKNKSLIYFKFLRYSLIDNGLMILICLFFRHVKC